MSHDIACRIFLNGQKHAGTFALVDEQDYDHLNGWKWYWSHGYAVRRCTHGEMLEHSDILRQKMIRMHQVILPSVAPLQTDHKNGDRLDNRRCNLRVVTIGQNAMNREKLNRNKSGFTGVFFCSWLKKNPWRAQIGVLTDGKKKQMHLGVYATAEEASAAYEAAAVKVFGEYRRQ